MFNRTVEDCYSLAITVGFEILRAASLKRKSSNVFGKMVTKFGYPLDGNPNTASWQMCNLLNTVADPTKFWRLCPLPVAPTMCMDNAGSHNQHKRMAVTDHHHNNYCISASSDVGFIHK